MLVTDVPPVPEPALVRRDRDVPRAGVPAEHVHEGHGAGGRVPRRRARARPGKRVLDVGCGPGRHSLALARRGKTWSASTISPEFVGLARDGAEADGLRRNSSGSTSGTLAYDGESTRRCVCVRAGSGCWAGATSRPFSGASPAPSARRSPRVERLLVGLRGALPRGRRDLRSRDRGAPRAVGGPGRRATSASSASGRPASPRESSKSWPEGGLEVDARARRHARPVPCGAGDAHRSRDPAPRAATEHFRQKRVKP